MVSAGHTPTIAIIGGGFSGAAVAYHLWRLLPSNSNVRILVFEPRQSIGGGLAYGTTDPTHRINVPAARMSLDPTVEEHFTRWLSADAVAQTDVLADLPDGRSFPRREAFGRYVADHLALPILERKVAHVRGRVKSLRHHEGAWRITSAAGAFSADVAVLATTHPPPSVPSALQSFAGDACVVADPLVKDALATIGPGDTTLIVGTGLTMADVVASLTARGHTGQIVAVSRRGQRSRGHGPWPMQGFDYPAGESRTALALLQAVRAALTQAIARGQTWHAVFDSLRAKGTIIWKALPISERRRLVRHLRPFWDAHRFRIAPQVEAALNSRLADGSLEIHAASLKSCTRTADGRLAVVLRSRHTANAVSRRFDRIVVTTGPSHSAIFDTQPFLADLRERGVLLPDECNLGIACDDRARAVGCDGAVTDTLFVAGPLARGTFGELMGLPEVANQARFVAKNAIETLRIPSLSLADSNPNFTEEKREAL